ncbi:MAG TPA: zinc ABC transporter substrate-binding protein, partial [Acidimicrobiales bacterium]|nr:zinc ABC transporter substrate-binding protein [Acidimicrobiales bacterium]
IDPHDYEPTPADLNAFTDARLVVVNGVGYDAWASKAADSTSPKPLVVDAGDVVGKTPGDNPHIWYGPDYVRAVASAITTQLEAVAPAASAYFEAQAATWRTEMKSYDDTVSEVRSQATGAVTYGATESVFDYMAAAVGLVDKTPEGYAHAVANESEPAPADLHDFLTAIGDGSIDLLIVNTQTEGSVPDQLRKAAEVAGVPIVEVTESPPTSSTFVSWQVGQLEALAKAVGSSR